MGAARPVWTLVGMVTNPSVAEAKTHGASGMAQLNARALPCRGGVDSSKSCAEAGTGTTVRRTATTVMTIATTTMAPATTKETPTPDSPAPTIRPAANGPMAKPVLNTAPAAAAPAGPFRSEAHAVPDVIARPTPTPTMNRPTSNTSACCESSIAVVPTKHVVEPANATAWRPSASEARPPMSNPGSNPTA